MPNANIPLILAFTGCVALLAGLFGGGFKAEEIVVPTISRLPRVFSGLAGIALIGAAIWLYVKPAALSAPQPTEVAKTVALSSPESPSPATLTSQQPAPTDTVTPFPSASPSPSAGLTDTATLPPTATPIVPDPRTPVGFLRYYFNLLTVFRDYGDAWQLLTRKFQNKNYPNGSRELGAYWNTIERVDLDNVQVTPLTSVSVDCNVDMTIHARSGSAEKITAVYRLIYVTKLQTWMFDIP